VTRDTLFYRFVVGLFVLMLLYGIGMIVTFSFVSESTALRMISAFAAMFSGTLGLGAGYLLAKNGNGH
jgi:hypothetical protein